MIETFTARPACPLSIRRVRLYLRRRPARRPPRYLGIELDAAHQQTAIDRLTLATTW
jgi:hypothetical protein